VKTTVTVPKEMKDHWMTAYMTTILETIVSRYGPVSTGTDQC